MTPAIDAAFRSWPAEPWLWAGLLLTAAVYLRGWLAYRRRDPGRWHPGQPAAFLGGLAAVFLALGSPVEPFAGLLAQVHMLQHLLLMMAAPPLLWLGEPALPLLLGLPAAIRSGVAAPVLTTSPLRRLFESLAHPLVAWPLFVGLTWLWHVPAMYELALRSPGWHYVQHLCFLGAGLAFWHPVVRPYPSRPRWSPWLLVPYLLLADVSNTVLSAVLTFSDQVLYPHYEAVPRLGGRTALDDQGAAGVLMWVPGSVAFLLPLAVVGLKLLFPPPAPRPPPARRIGLPVVAPPRPGFDLLRVPVLGRFLKWRHARLALQLPPLALAAVVVLDGLTGPQAGATNLAGVLPWVHWRGLLILGLLAAGNVFCMACPFTLPRALARRWLPAGRPWPRWLRTKWPGVLLLAVFLWAYEAFSLWDSPWLTAWIVVGYFAAAFALDAVFRGSPFCKSVCPIGQFNFVQSLMSPLGVTARDPAVCAACRTKDCVRGRDTVPGCGLHLYVPRKSGNLDCTLCLDCVHACPHDNVSVTASVPAAELWHDRTRSGLGRLSRRPDFAALVVLLTFGALANAAGMVAPVAAAGDAASEWLGVRSRLVVVTAFYVCALFILPAVLMTAAAAASRAWGRLPLTTLAVATRFAYALVPLGFAVWLAHYSFHLLTGYEAAVPATQRFAADLGWPVFGEPAWSCACCRPAADWLLKLELLALDLGLLSSLYAAYRIARPLAPVRPLRAAAPWGVLLTLLFAAGVWVLLQPMEMRGTLPPG